MALRYYQEDAHRAVIDHIRSSLEPCIVEAATGAGKSHIIAAIAETIHTASKGKRILCLAPNAKLVKQNRAKYIATGNPASIFSSSAGQKCLRHPIVFGTPGTVKNRISSFGSMFAAVILDEADGITPTIISIIDVIKEENPNLRVIGLTATPYRLSSGYIYKIDENSKPNCEDSCRDPYFTKKVYTITAHELIEQGYLTRPVIGAINSTPYETINLKLNSLGRLSKEDTDRAYHGQGRKTSAIIADIINNSKDRKGVMIFASTIQHAKECMASLPPSLSVMITSEDKNPDEKLSLFESQQVKYIVNVEKYTVGFDDPHVDHIAILRLSESKRLIQQIIGRGLRVHPGKKDCLISDYAQNIDRHCPDGDIFNPDVKSSYKSGEKVYLTAECPSCGIDNEFSARPNLDGFNISKSGYFLDLDNNEIKTDFGSMPAHFGRRCNALLPSRGGMLEQCNYRWTFKPCPYCDEDNDIAARYCRECKGEIIDPNEKLHIEFKQLKKDPTRVQVDKIISMNPIPTVTRSGKEGLRVDFVTEYRSFAVWFINGRHEKRLFDNVTNGATIKPETITYVRDPNTKFYRVLAYNQGVDRDESTRILQQT